MDKNLKAGLIVGGVAVAILAVAFVAQAAGLTRNTTAWPWGNNYGYGMMGGNYGGMMGSGTRGGNYYGGMMGGAYGGMMNGYYGMGPQMMQGWNGWDYDDMPCGNWTGSTSQQPNQCPCYNQSGTTK